MSPVNQISRTTFIICLNINLTSMKMVYETIRFYQLNKKIALINPT